MIGDDQPDAREGQAGRIGVAERLVVPTKPGNSGGGKGPQFRTDARRGEGPGDWETYQLRKGLKNRRGRHAPEQRRELPVREPDAGNPHVRFDERGVETGATAELMRHRQTKEAATDRPDLPLTAPHPDSTP